MFKGIKKIVDAGYYTFVVGLHGDFAHWNKERIEFKRDGVLMLLDRSPTFRKELLPEYKSRRKKKRDDDPERMAKYQRVREFRALVEEDPVVPTIAYPGVEADDLVALLHLWTQWEDRKPFQVVAIDKDLYQVPGLHAVMKDRMGKTKPFQMRKLSGYAKQPKPPWSWAFTQAIYGDKSDSIPRLLSSNGHQARRQYLHCTKTSKPLHCFRRARDLFGEQFMRNLWLVLMPGPFLRIDWPMMQKDWEYTFSLLTTGAYWTVAQNWEAKVFWHLERSFQQWKEGDDDGW